MALGGGNIEGGEGKNMGLRTMYTLGIFQSLGLGAWSLSDIRSSWSCGSSRRSSIWSTSPSSSPSHSASQWGWCHIKVLHFPNPTLRILSLSQHSALKWSHSKLRNSRYTYFWSGGGGWIFNVHIVCSSFYKCFFADKNIL